MSGDTNSLAVLKRFSCSTDDQTRPGDSGGPYFEKHAAFGIHRGRLGDCRSLYSGAVQAENELDVDIRTTR